MYIQTLLKRQIPYQGGLERITNLSGRLGQDNDCWSAQVWRASWPSMVQITIMHRNFFVNSSSCISSRSAWSGSSIWLCSRYWNWRYPIVAHHGFSRACRVTRPSQHSMDWRECKYVYFLQAHACLLLFVFVCRIDYYTLLPIWKTPDSPHKYRKLN